MSKQTCFLSEQDLKDLPKLLSEISNEMYNLPDSDPGKNSTWSLVEGYERIEDNVSQPRASIYSSSNKKHEGHYIIAFKGTDPKSSGDIITDANILPVKFKPFYDGCNSNVKIHSGFNSMYVKLRSDLFKFLNDGRQTIKLYITGHSLGGALAHIFLYDLMVSLRSQMPEAVCVSIAAPRIGNYYASQDFTSRLRRFRDKRVSFVNIVGGLDPVPKLPLTLIEMSHAGQVFALPIAKVASKMDPARVITYYDCGQHMRVGNGGHSVSTYIEDIKKQNYIE